MTANDPALLLINDRNIPGVTADPKYPALVAACRDAIDWTIERCATVCEVLAQVHVRLRDQLRQ